MVIESKVDKNNDAKTQARQFTLLTGLRTPQQTAAYIKKQ